MHVSFIINKREMYCCGKSLPELTRYVADLVRKKDGTIGLVEDRGAEYWMTTIHPISRGQ